jgi:hypothetical protein
MIFGKIEKKHQQLPIPPPNLLALKKNMYPIAWINTRAYGSCQSKVEGFGKNKK